MVEMLLIPCFAVICLRKWDRNKVEKKGSDGSRCSERMKEEDKQL